MMSMNSRTGVFLRKIAIIVLTLVVSQPCPKPSSAQSASATISSFSLQVSYVCPGENAVLTWSIASDDASAVLRCEFDYEGDGIIDKVIAHCQRSGEISFLPAVTGAIRPRMKVMLGGIAMALSRTQGFVHEPPAKQHSSAAERLRFGTHGPADFYATDVAIGQNGKVYVTDWLRRRLRRYSNDGTLELEYPQLVGQPRRLAVAGNGHVYVSEVPLNKIHRYDADGIELDVWDLTTRFGYGIGTGGVEFVAPDRLLIAASSDTILVVSLEGELIFRFGSQGAEPGQFSSIFDVAPASDGSYFVVDRTHRLHKFDASGTFLWSRGGYGTDPGLFDVPVAVGVAPSGNVYVSDRRNYRVQKFDQDGNFLLAWGDKGSGEGQFNWHYGLDIDQSTGDVWVAGYHGHDVQKFSEDGRLLDRWIGHVTAPDEFAYAAGIAVSDERIFVVDQVNQQIKVFDKATQAPLYQFGERGDGPGTVFNFPRAVTLAPTGELYVTEDRVVRRLQQDGTFVRTLNSLTKNISASMGLFVDSDTLYQADTNNSQLVARNALSGKLVWAAGSTGLEPGQFTRIWGISPGAGGMLLATDAGNRVQLFTKAGHYVRQWITVQPGTTDAAPSRGIAFDPGRSIVYVGSGSTINAYDMCGTPLFSWTPSAPASPGLLFDHLSVDGQGTVFATDHFGTVYGVSPLENTPAPDTAPPTGTLTINSDAAATRSTAATLTLTATDAGGGALQMCVSGTTSCNAWAAFAGTAGWTLPAGEGIKTVYAWFRDQAGNTSEVYSDTIVLDTVAPAKGTVSVTPGSLQLTLNFKDFSDSGGSGVVSYVASFREGTTPPSSCASGTPVPGSAGSATTLVHGGLTDGRAYTYKVCALDAAGNRSLGAIKAGTPGP